VGGTGCAGKVAVGIASGVGVVLITVATAVGDGSDSSVAGVAVGGVVQAVKKSRVRIRIVFFIYWPVRKLRAYSASV
jgi:hypothetical protein